MNRPDFLYSSGDIQNADRFAMEKLGIPSEILMENAGMVCSDFAASMTLPGERIVIMAGTGNNGGDGMVMARHLHRKDRDVMVFIAGRIDDLKGATLLNFSILDAIGIPCIELSLMADQDLENALSDADLLVDALLGTGAKGAPRGDVLRAVRAMKGRSPILALDGPTGVNLDDGSVFADTVLADLTVAMLARKIGHEVFPGKLFCGRVELAHIGVDEGAILPEPIGKETFSVNEEYVRMNYPLTSSLVHKGSRGGVLVVAGSPRYPGAAVLAARGALRGGAGLCILAAPEVVRSYVASIPEVIFEPLESPSEVIDVLDRWRDRCSTLIVGPGLDRTEFSRQVFVSSMSLWRGNIVVDGDGLFFLPETDISASSGLIVTPHEGEAAGLLGCRVADIFSRRLNMAESLGGKYGVCLLKGPGSIVCDSLTRAVEPSGAPTLAVPGSGDVLSGLIGALWSRGCSPFNAAALGGWIHGKVGELLFARSPDGFLASEIADMIPDVLGGVSREKT